MSPGPYTDDRRTARKPPEHRPDEQHPAPPEPLAFPCGCVACTNDNGSYTVMWCPQHGRAHGDVGNLVAQ